MIRVRIYKVPSNGDRETEIGRVDIINTEVLPDGTADYLAQFGVERIGAVGLHTRTIRAFPRLKFNVLALLKQVLDTLDPRELELENEVDPRDLARRGTSIGPSLPF